jgi:lysophospholipase L1-like esterase
MAVLRYVALGDSYTIGTAVPAGERWPDRLVAHLPGLGLVANLALNGWTSGDVLARQLDAALALDPGFVSLLVGVNDVVQAVPPARYRANVDAILAGLLAHLPTDRVLCVETPDYTVTPAGADYGDPATMRAGIVAANADLRRIAASRGVAFVDGILAISSEAGVDASLVAADGLHPSGEQYRRWVDERIAPVVRGLLGGREQGY